MNLIYLFSISLLTELTSILFETPPIFQLQFGSFHKVTVEMVFKALLILLLKYIYNSYLSFSLVTNGHKKMAMVTNFCLEIDFKKVKGNDWIFCK